MKQDYACQSRIVIFSVNLMRNEYSTHKPQSWSEHNSEFVYDTTIQHIQDLASNYDPYLSKAFVQI